MIDTLIKIKTVRVSTLTEIFKVLNGIALK